MHNVEIIYHKGCPNLDGARKVLRKALAEVGVEAWWREWDADSPSTPDGLRGYGSPTVLVDGRDVTGAAAGGGSSCRLYDDGEGGMSGVPTLERIVEALGDTPGSDLRGR